jgi:hypothetical protein
MKNITKPKKNINYNKIFALIGWAIIYTAVTVSVGAYFGMQHAEANKASIHSEAYTLAKTLK